MNTYLPATSIDVDLSKYFLVLKRRWLPAVLVFGSVTLLSILYAGTREPTYQTSGKILVKLDRTASLAGLDAPGGASIGEPNAVGLQSDPIATEVEAILSLAVAKETISALNLTDDEGQPLSPGDFFNDLEVRTIPGTDLIQIGYEDEDPAQAADVVNTVIDVYRSNNIATKQAEAIAAREFIAKQLPSTESAVLQAEAALQQFKEQNQIVVLDEQSREAVRAIQQIETEIAQTRAQLATVNAQSADLKRRLGMSPERALQATSLSQSAAVQETFTQIREVQGQLDLARARYRSTHPTISGLELQEAELQERLESRVAEAVGLSDIPRQDLQLGILEQDLTASLLQSEVELVGLSNRLNELTQLQAAQQSQANAFPRLEATLRQLERRLTVAQSTYEALLQRLQEVQVAQNQTIDNVRIVSQALVPEGPSSSKKLIVMAATIAGAILAVITAFALDLCDRSVKTVREAQSLLDLPILGVIPQLGRNAPFLIQPGDTSAPVMKQAYRMLQANLSFVGARAGRKTFVVTSAIAGEGCSMVAANLAITVAQAGNKVLLIDANLQKPDQHHIWRSQNQQGLIQVLEGNLEPAEAVQTVAPNLSLLTVGDPTHDSLATFENSKVRAFIEKMAQTFDIILLDAPPLTQTADASTLGTLADGSLVVVRPQLVKAADIEAAKGLMQLSRQPVLGMVINGIKDLANPSQYFAYTSDSSLFASAPHMTLPTEMGSPENNTYSNDPYVVGSKSRN
jgi:capsular exopolysaccharide synthesis family protein